MKNNKKLEDTQKLDIQKKEIYGDNFENTSMNEERITRRFNKSQLKSIVICTLSVMLFILVLAIIIFGHSIGSTNKKNFQKANSTLPINSTSTIPQKESTFIKTYIPTETGTILIESETIPIATTPTEIPTSIPTESSSIISTETPSSCEPPTIIEKSSEPDYITEPIERSMSVSDISVDIQDTNLAIVSISGEFSGYSTDELLKLISLNTTSGNPIILNPYMNNNLFTFYINLENCEGQLDIELGNYYYYQSI